MLKEVRVPDIGAFSGVSIIEILVKVGDIIAKDASLITLETDKATLEIPSPYAGIVKEIKIKVDDKVSEGDVILVMDVADSGSTIETPAEQKLETPVTKQGDKGTSVTDSANPPSKEANDINLSKEALDKTSVEPKQSSQPEKTSTTGSAHAGPGVRRFARELGVDLTKVSGNGRKSRILVSDVKLFVKNILSNPQRGAGASGGTGLNIAPWPQIDHAKFGPVSVEPLSRIKKLSGTYLHRNWVMVPHVTQFDEADTTEMEQFRKESQGLAESQGVKLTPLVFIMKAVVNALKNFPLFNASLDADGSQLIFKKYFHLGVAVDTPNGLVVPVVRDVDQKGLFQLAKELGELSAKARKGALTAADMQGSSFSISSLGGIGGTAFTPIVNVPDVAILGVSRAQIKPIYDGKEFIPRLMLPLSLSYDHRVIDGAEAARFTSYLVKQLSDIRRLLL